MFGGRKWYSPLSAWKLSNGGAAPPQPTAEELAAQNAEATLTVQKIIVGSILLYLCKLIYITHLQIPSASK